MSRILCNAVDEPWFDELSAVSTYSEGEYEEKIKQYSESIFNEYYTIRLKKGVTHNNKTKKPDLALISKDYMTWWVVEAELANHSIDHVLDQVTVFREGEYNPVTYTKYIKKVFAEEIPNVVLDEAKLETLIRDCAPEILVIVDEPCEEWRTVLEKEKIKLCDLQVFRNSVRDEAYKIGGDYPAIYIKHSFLKFHKLVRNTLEVINVKDFKRNLTNGEEITIIYRGRTTKWGVDVVKDKTYIKCLGQKCPASYGNNYTLQLDRSNKLTIKDS